MLHPPRQRRDKAVNVPAETATDIGAVEYLLQKDITARLSLDMG